MSALWRLPGVLICLLGFGGISTLLAAPGAWERAQHTDAIVLTVGGATSLGAAAWIWITWRRLPRWTRQVQLLPALQPQAWPGAPDSEPSPWLVCSACLRPVLPMVEALTLDKVIKVARLHAQWCSPPGLNTCADPRQTGEAA